MDSLAAIMKVFNTLQTLTGSMTNTEIANTVNKLLDGLQVQRVNLSDQYIQTSIAKVL
jgi:hypothetical protein